MRNVSTSRLKFRSVAAVLCMTCWVCFAEAARGNEENRPATDNAGTEDDEAAFQKGRQLLQERRLAEASQCFQRVHVSHKRFPQALLGILFCAQYCPNTDLTRLAQYTAALPEDYHPAELAAHHDQLRPITVMLDSMQRCRKGNFAEAHALMRTLENDATLSTDMRQRVRLEIAELFYLQDAISPAPAEPSPEAEQDPQGLAEETLLQFIATNPESRLLEAAFYRLKRHHALEKSTYVLSKLQEWSQDTEHPRRAGLAFLSLLQRLQAQGGDTTDLANRAATELPSEPATRIILREHVRDLQAHGHVEAARPYLSLLEGLEKNGPTSARTTFLRAYDTQNTPREAATLFLRCARDSAPGELKTAAMVNALICAMHAGDHAMAENLLNESEDVETKRALLLVHAQLLPDGEQGDRATEELREVMRLKPTARQRISVELEQNRRRLKKAPAKTLRELQRYDAEQRAKWTDEQELYYAAMIEEAVHLAHPGNNELAHHLLRSLVAEASTLSRKEALTLHTARRLSDAGRHAAARDLLLELADEQPVRESRAATLLYAGRECELCGTLPALKHAVALYANILRHETQLRPLAGVLRAAILTRINRTEEALNQLASLDTTAMKPDLLAHYNMVLADALAYSGTVERMEQAINVCRQTLENPGTPLLWHMRTHLQRGILNTRLRRDDEALQDYRSVLQEMPTDKTTAESAGGSMYYDAAAGAVYRLVQQRRFSEAAELARQAASWPGTTEQPAPANEERARRFAQWAHMIRQISFQPDGSISFEMP